MNCSTWCSGRRAGCDDCRKPGASGTVSTVASGQNHGIAATHSISFSPILQIAWCFESRPLGRGSCTALSGSERRPDVRQVRQAVRYERVLEVSATPEASASVPVLVLRTFDVGNALRFFSLTSPEAAPMTPPVPASDWVLGFAQIGLGDSRVSAVRTRL